MAGQNVISMYGVGYNQSTLDGGMQVGDTITVYDFANSGFKECMLVRADEQLSAQSSLRFTGIGIVSQVTTAGQIAVGVNDVSGYGPGVALGVGAVVADNNYFYMTFRGTVNANVDAAVSAFAALATGSAAPGYLDAWTDGAATFRQTNLMALEDSDAGGNTLSYIF